MNKKQNSNNNYVYLLIDPRDNKIFYVGKGIKKRAKSHLKEKNSEKEKNLKIKEIADSGNDVKIDLLSNGLSNSEALKIEAAAIDLIGIENLTNTQRGYHSKENGRREFTESAVYGVESIKQKDWEELKGKALIINIAKSFSYKLTPEELYNNTRSAWHIDECNRNKIEFVLSVNDSIVREVYKVAGWFKDGETTDRDYIDETRVEFVGKIAEENIRKKYKYKSISKQITYKMRNPIVYIK